MWAEIKTNSGKDVRVLNDNYIELKKADFEKLGGYFGAALGVFAVLVFQLGGIIAAILYLCFIFAFGWVFEKGFELSGKKKKQDGKVRETLRSASFLSRQSILQIEKAKLATELGDSRKITKTENGWQIEYKKNKYNVIDQGDESFRIEVDGEKEMEADDMEKEYGYLAYHFQKLCENGIDEKDEIYKKAEFEPTAKDHAILITKIVIIFAVIATVLFSSTGSAYVNAVKNGCLSSFPDQKIGEALEKKCTSITWSSHEYEGAVLVTFTGWIKGNGSKQKLEIDFVVFEDFSFQMDDIWLDGDVLNWLESAYLLATIFGE